MHLSQRSDYALRALVELAQAYPQGRLLSAKDISKSEGVPIKFLEQILLTLKHAGIVRSKMGVKGGYTLAKDPNQITFGSVIRIFEGPVAPIGCVNPNEKSLCSELWHCKFHRVMVNLRDAISGVIDKTTLADVMGPVPANQGQAPNLVTIHVQTAS